MRRWITFLVTWMAVMGTSCPIAFAAQRELVVVNFGGTFGENWRKLVIQPFAKENNVKVTEVVSVTFDTLAKLRAQKDNPQIDVALMAEPGLVLAAKEGLIDPLDPAMLPVLPELIPQAKPAGLPYVLQNFNAMVLAYNTTKIPTAPISWRDLWNPAYKGHVVMPAMNACCGVATIALFAKMTGTDLNNVDPAFDLYKTLRPNVLTYYTSHDQITQMLLQGEAWISAWVSDLVATHKVNENAPIDMVYPKEGGVLFGNGPGVVHGSKNKDLAYKYINFLLQPKQMKAFSEVSFTGPTNAKAGVAPDLAKYLVTLNGQINQSLNMNLDIVAKKTSEWTERFQREILAGQ